jgi:membrane protease YdiL (CAAX protease family)
MARRRFDEPLAGEGRPAQLLGQVACVLALLAAITATHRTAALRQALASLPHALRAAGPLPLFAPLLALLWWFTRSDPSRTATFGFRRVPLSNAIGWGALALIGGIACHVLFTMTYLGLTGGSDQKPPAVVQDVLRHTSLWGLLVLSATVGLLEEAFFRGFVLGRLVRAFHGWALTRKRSALIAVGASAAAFALSHVYQGGSHAFGAFGFGLVYAAVVLRCGSIWPLVVAHFCNDALFFVSRYGSWP